MEGNPYLARMINASMASLLNTFRDDVHFGGAASGGLCSDAYAGGTGGGWGASDSARSSHRVVAWLTCLGCVLDIETWQFPVFLTFYPEIAQPVLRYRADRQDGAAVNARIRRGGPAGCNQPECGWIDHNVSYDGLLYPIMTALTGLDNDGEPEPHWPSEDHMTGDISLAFQQFWQATHNVTWLKEEGFGLLHGIARFWASKAVRNDDGSYSIPQTGTPDEYHNNVRQKRC